MTALLSLSRLAVIFEQKSRLEPNMLRSVGSSIDLEAEALYEGLKLQITILQKRR